MVVNGDSQSFFTTYSVLKITVWAGMMYFFAWIEFGLVFFIASVVYCIFANLGEKRWSHEVSAYSVFNKDFTSIGGTLSGAQVDGELRSGGAVVDNQSSSVKQGNKLHFRGPGHALNTSSNSSTSSNADDSTDVAKDRELRRKQAREAALKRVNETNKAS